MKSEALFRVRFIQQDQVFEVYARNVHQGELYGFVTIEELVFDSSSSVVVDPSEEKLKSEFAGVKRTMVPMHAVVRIDEVDKRGTAKIRAVGDTVRPFPMPAAPSGPSTRPPNR